MSEATCAPTVGVVRGEPTAEELAALVAVLVARSGDAGEGALAPEPISGWTDRSRYVRRRRTHGAGGWRASTLPR